MSLDKELNAHLDKQDALEAEFREEIDLIIKAIDRNTLFKDPARALKEVATSIGDLMEQKYMHLSADNGFMLGKLLLKYKKQGKDIIVDNSNNPTENKELANDSDKRQE